jgi:hypothetical protein
MKPGTKRIKRKEDESLFGLLSLYKDFNTYVRVLVSEDEKILSVQLTDNPANWKNIPKNRYEKYRQLSRLDMGFDRLSLKYLAPKYIVKNMGPLLNIKIPPDGVTVTDALNEGGYFILEASMRYRKKILQGLGKMLNMSPHKKLEIIEKCIAVDQEE